MAKAGKTVSRTRAGGAGVHHGSAAGGEQGQYPGEAPPERAQGEGGAQGQQAAEGGEEDREDGRHSDDVREGAQAPAGGIRLRAAQVRAGRKRVAEELVQHRRRPSGDAAAALHPGTLKPVGPDDLAPLFPMELIMQEVSAEREIAIPEPVRDIYRMWRPTPLYRAYGLEKALGTTAKIYYKYEGVSPAGSHKPNTAVAQAFYNKQAGVKKLVTETGAGQWGSSLSFAGALFDIDVKVYMVKISYNQKPYRRALMEVYGGTWWRAPRSRPMRDGRSSPPIRIRMEASASPSRRPSKWLLPTPTQNMHWAAC